MKVDTEAKAESDGVAVDNGFAVTLDNPIKVGQSPS